MQLSPLGGNPEPVELLIERFRHRAEKLGLYLREASLATNDPQTAMQVGEDPDALMEAISDQSVALVLAFQIGDVAYSKRVQNPDQYEVDKEAQVILPDPNQEHIEKVRKALEEGRSILDLDDDEEPDVSTE